MSTGTGANVSKGLGYAVLDNPAGENVSKALAYVVLDLPPGLNLSKAVAYAILDANNTNPPVWPSFTFASGVVGSAYSQNFDLTPAASPTTYTLQSGTLPPGLSLSNVAGDIGQLSGTPTTAGSYSFTLRATNAYGFADQPFTLTVSSPSSGGGGAWIYIC